MAGSSISQAKMRSAKAAAKAIVKKQVEVEVPPHVLKARNSFAYFCELMGKEACSSYAGMAQSLLDWPEQ